MTFDEWLETVAKKMHPGGPMPFEEELLRAGWEACLKSNKEPVAKLHCSDGLVARDIELMEGMIEVHLSHATRCEYVQNRKMAEKQKGWDLERVALLEKLLKQCR